MVSTQVKKTSQINTLVEATLSSDDLSISGTVKNRMSGYYAWGHRQDVEEKKDTKNPYVGPEIAEENDFLSVTNFVQKDLQNLDSPVATYYNFDYQEYLEKIDGKLYFEPLLFFGKKQIPSRRKYVFIRWILAILPINGSSLNLRFLQGMK